MQQASKSPATGLNIAPLKDDFGAQIFDVDLQLLIGHFKLS